MQLNIWTECCASLDKTGYKKAPSPASISFRFPPKDKLLSLYLKCSRRGLHGPGGIKKRMPPRGLEACFVYLLRACPRRLRLPARPGPASWPAGACPAPASWTCRPGPHGSAGQGRLDGRALPSCADILRSNTSCAPCWG